MGMWWSKRKERKENRLNYISKLEDMKGLMSQLKFGDIILIRSTLKLDKTTAVSTYVGCDIILALQSMCLVSEKKSFCGWDSCALVIEGNDGNGGELHLLEVDNQGIHTYNFMERIRHHENYKHKMGVMYLNVPIDAEMHETLFNTIYYLLDNDFKYLMEGDDCPEMIQRTFAKIKEFAKLVHPDSKMYKEYNRKFLFFTQGSEIIFPKEIPRFLEVLEDDRGVTPNDTQNFWDKYGDELKQREAYTFEELFTILKQDFLYYKSFYEINVDSIVSGEIIISLLEILQVVRFRDYVMEMPDPVLYSCDELRKLCDEGTEGVEMALPYTYQPLLYYVKTKPKS